MSNLTITNNDHGSVVIDNEGKFDYDTFNLPASLVGLQPEGLVLARDSVSSKLVDFVPGGAALKETSEGPFALVPGDAFILDVDNVGNATVTFDATRASITDTTTYPVTDQDGLTMTITITGGRYDGLVQTITFSGATTTAAGIAAQINAQALGVRASVVGGQVELETDGAGDDFDIATGAGTGDLTWGSSTAGTGDVGDIGAVTADEVKTLVEADTTATVTVSGQVATIKGTEELDFISGTALAKLGLSVETITANGNGIPIAIMPYEFTAVAGDNVVRPLFGGRVRARRLVIRDGSAVTVTIKDQLRDYGIVPLTSPDYSLLDNQ